jgi:hypothetical protein
LKETGRTTIQSRNTFPWKVKNEVEGWISGQSIYLVRSAAKTLGCKSQYNILTIYVLKITSAVPISA